jgi:hypothetical protein
MGLGVETLPRLGLIPTCIECSQRQTAAATVTGENKRTAVNTALVQNGEKVGSRFDMARVLATYY